LPTISLGSLSVQHLALTNFIVQVYAA
jgi:hypothetical protein